MTIRFRILLACLLMTAATVALGLFALRNERRLGDLTFTMYDKAFMAMNFARSAEMKLAVLRSKVIPLQGGPALSERQRLIAGAEAATQPTKNVSSDRDSLLSAISDIQDDLNVAVERAPSETAKAAAVALSRDVGTLATDAGGPKLQQLDAIAAEFDQAVELLAQSGFEDRNRAAAYIEDSLRSTAIAIAGSVLAAIAISIGLSRAIVPPLHRAASVAQAIAQGRLDNDIPPSAQKGRSEATRLLAALARMQAAIGDNLRKLDDMHRSEEEQRTAVEAERARNEVTRAAAAKSLSQVLALLAAGLERLAAGDLTCRMDADLPPEYESLRKDFNATAHSLHTVLGCIVSTTSSIRAGSGEIADAADHLSSRSEQQATALAQTAASLDGITLEVKRTAEGIDRTCEVIAKTKLESEESGDVVRNAVRAMGEIERSSQEIGQIISVIDEIAFQTNLLALNAGVEAARAGETGRGFAVVASEVRALAQRSADAAKQIRALITNSDQEVAKGVKLVNQTGLVLSRIAGQVSEATDFITDIARSTQDQARSLAGINAAVTEMDGVTRANAAMVEESRSAARALADVTEDLSVLTERFQLEHAHAEPRMPVARTPVREARNGVLSELGYGDLRKAG